MTIVKYRGVPIKILLTGTDGRGGGGGEAETEVGAGTGAAQPRHSRAQDGAVGGSSEGQLPAMHAPPRGGMGAYAPQFCSWGEGWLHWPLSGMGVELCLW